MKKTQRLIVVAKNVLKSFMLICVPFWACGQQLYFMIDLDYKSTDYKITHFNLSAKELYGVEKHVEIFNVLPLLNEDPRQNSQINKQKSRYLFTFSVLPVFDSTSNWISYSKKPTNLVSLSFNDLLNLGNRSIQQNQALKTADRYALLLKKDNKYYTSKSSFLQIFYVRDYPAEFSVPHNVIDTNQTFLTVRAMKEIYEKEFKGGEFPLLPNVDSRDFDSQKLERFYLSKKIPLGQVEGYQFWTFAPWGGVMDDVEWQRGIDRFVYVSNKGIVGGSYDFYFKDSLPKQYPPLARRNINMLEFKNNILDEKIMLGREIKTSPD